MRQLFYTHFDNRITPTSPTETNIQAAIAYCEYVFERYGRFPAYSSPMRTVLGFQVNHVDIEFYDRFYRPEAIGEAQREHLKRWHEDRNV